MSCMFMQNADDFDSALSVDRHLKFELLLEWTELNFTS